MYQIFKFNISLSVFLLLFNINLLAQESKNKINQLQKESNFLIRPNANIGVVNKDFVYSYGFRVLLKAGSNKAYGIEISRFNRKDNRFFYTAGIILEQKLWKCFNSSIGTIGYFNFEGDSKNTVGLTSNLGWEPNSNKRLSPFITYRSDFIFTSKMQSINTLNIGLNIKL
jgi:hypothetical protein